MWPCPCSPPDHRGAGRCGRRRLPALRSAANGNGNGKKKLRKRIIIISVVVGVVLLGALGLFAFTRGGTKIDPSKLAKVEKGDLAKSVGAVGTSRPASAAVRQNDTIVSDSGYRTTQVELGHLLAACHSDNKPRTRPPTKPWERRADSPARPS